MFWEATNVVRKREEEREGLYIHTIKFWFKNTSTLLQKHLVTTLLQSFGATKAEKFGKAAGPEIVRKLQAMF